MEMRYPHNKEEVKRFTTDELRQNYMVENLFTARSLRLVYTHIDRVIMGGAYPVEEPVKLMVDPKEVGADFLLQRREMGVVNVGGPGKITVDGTSFDMQKLDGLYISMGSQDVSFESADANNPANFYLVSTPAHAAYPTTHLPISQAEPLRLGDNSNSNKRTIYKFIHPDGVKSCQLMLGVTLLEPNNMWNTMPAHTHARRMEVYFYFDIEGENVVFHLMGEPNETRHLVMRDKQAVISPSWSIHAGMGTGNYAFVWAMAGENQAFTDMDMVAMDDLR